MNGIIPAVRTITREICGPEHVVICMNYVGGKKMGFSQMLISFLRMQITPSSLLPASCGGFPENLRTVVGTANGYSNEFEVGGDVSDRSVNTERK